MTQVANCDVESKEDYKKPSAVYYIIKKIFDFLSSLILCIVLIIPMIIIAGLVVINDFGNPFYVQQRMGKNGKKIKVYKFRTMKVGADKLEMTLTDEQREQYEREFKLRDDPRLIGYKEGKGNRCFGAILRKTSLDELPQIFFNILIFGNMSFIGPRPILEDELNREYTQEQKEIFMSVKPGLTGYWQAYSRNNFTYQSGERQKMELYYINNQSIKFDVRILFKTVISVFKAEGAI